MRSEILKVSVLVQVLCKSTVERVRLRMCAYSDEDGHDKHQEQAALCDRQDGGADRVEG